MTAVTDGHYLHVDSVTIIMHIRV